MQMLGNRVAVEPLIKSKSSGGLLQMPDDSHNTGKVKFIGPECIGIEVGQTIFFGNQREPVKVNGNEFIVMEDSNVFGILDEEKDQEIQN